MCHLEEKKENKNDNNIFIKNRMPVHAHAFYAVLCLAFRGLTQVSCMSAHVPMITVHCNLIVMYHCQIRCSTRTIL